MYKLTIFLVTLVTFVNTSFSQFKGMVAEAGFAYKASAAISIPNFRFTGGGVVLKGTASPSYRDTYIDFTNISFYKGNTITTATLTTQDCKVMFTSKTWIMKDAINLINGEDPNNLYRDVNLLGSPNMHEDTLKYPRTDYWYVEIHEPLIATKTGETLLLIDVLQTDLNFYADKDKSTAIRTYQEARERILEQNVEETFKLLEYINSVDLDNVDENMVSEADKMKLWALWALLPEDATDDDFLKTIYEIHDASNWTYNDELTKYLFHCDCDNKTLRISGRPTFTFLTLGYENERLTDYFTENYHIIENLKSRTFKDAVEFARVSSFFRYLKESEYELWLSLERYFATVPKEQGKTPRIFKK